MSNQQPPIITERFFDPEDIVEYRPFENCSKKDIAKGGFVEKKLEDGYYTVLFGDYKRKIGWWSTGTYHWTKLWKESNEPKV